MCRVGVLISVTEGNSSVCRVVDPIAGTCNADTFHPLSKGAHPLCQVLDSLICFVHRIL